MVSRSEFFSNFSYILSDEKLSLTKFLSLPDDISTKELRSKVWENFLSVDDSEKVWEDVGNLAEFCETMVRYLKGELYVCPGMCGPLDTESYLILPELIELTSLGFPTFCSQPGISKLKTVTGIWNQLPFVDFICSKKIYKDLVKLLSKEMTVFLIVYGKPEKHYIHPDHKPFIRNKRLIISENLETSACGISYSLKTSQDSSDSDNHFESCFCTCVSEDFTNKVPEENVLIQAIGTDFSNQLFSQILNIVKKF